LSGRHALVTGAGSGIGLATVRALLGHGAKVAAVVQSDAQRGALAGLLPADRILVQDLLDDAACGLIAARGTLHVRAVFEDSAGRVWIGNNGIGVLLYENGLVTHFTEAMQLSRMGMHGDRTLPLPSDAPLGAPSMHRVFSIGEGRDGHMWFGTVEMGAWRYDGTAMRQFTAADGLTTKDVMGIYTDRRGDLWVAGNGVFRFDGVKFERRF
jgi:NAD(P)-dependent dehydrogenase (short-subunit alcohol dehydrogenase family)